MVPAGHRGLSSSFSEEQGEALGNGVCGGPRCLEGSAWIWLMILIYGCGLPLNYLLIPTLSIGPLIWARTWVWISGSEVPTLRNKCFPGETNLKIANDLWVSSKRTDPTTSASTPLECQLPERGIFVCLVNCYLPCGL